VELEHLKIETRLTIDKFASGMGEYAGVKKKKNFLKNGSAESGEGRC
jgi:hypothetical protein